MGGTALSRRVAYPRPGSDGLWFAPAQRSYRWLGKRDSFKDGDGALQLSRECAAGQMDERPIGRRMLRLFSDGKKNWKRETKMNEPHDIQSNRTNDR